MDPTRVGVHKKQMPSLSEQFVSLSDCGFKQAPCQEVTERNSKATNLPRITASTVETFPNRSSPHSDSTENVHLKKPSTLEAMLPFQLHDLA